MKHLLASLILAVLAIAFTGAASAQDRYRDSRKDKAGQFDFYVLSLSWSPTFCGGQHSRNNDQQCGTSQGFGFVVHGLWPQNERGYPQFCESREQDRVPQALGKPLFDIMPSMGLIGNEWRKHGTCTGLSQRDYLTKIRAAYNRVRLPADLSGGQHAVTLSADQIEDKFVAANPGLSRRSMSTSCQGPRLEEVRICLTKDLQFRDCDEVDRDGCRIGQVTLPASR